MSAFTELVVELINHHPFLHPVISRKKSTDWVAAIYKSDREGDKVLAIGQAETLEEACNKCAGDYHVRVRKQARKEELMKEPLVREAMEIFGFKPSGEAEG